MLFFAGIEYSVTYHTVHIALLGPNGTHGVDAVSLQPAPLGFEAFPVYISHEMDLSIPVMDCATFQSR